MQQNKEKENVLFDVLTVIAWPFVIMEKVIIETVKNLGILPLEKEEKK
jgi:hypothetical protein